MRTKIQTVTDMGRGVIIQVYFIVAASHFLWAVRTLLIGSARRVPAYNHLVYLSPPRLVSSPTGNSEEKKKM